MNPNINILNVMIPSPQNPSTCSTLQSSADPYISQADALELLGSAIRYHETLGAGIANLKRLVRESLEGTCFEPDALEKKYAGKPFIFRSGSQHTPGIENGERGIVVRRLLESRGDAVGAEVPDLWLVRNASGEYVHVWGGELFDENRQPIIPEHAFDGQSR